uniref:Protein phosphatase 2c n=1 Tax=Solanum tuberosum TaxID=4113 RepID=M1AUH3_SOLTU
MKMVAGSFYIPKSNKAPLWEDAHFICIEEETIGVADGIGGWAKRVSILENIQDNWLETLNYRFTNQKIKGTKFIQWKFSTRLILT